MKSTSISKIPDVSSCVVVLSGGMDSAIAARLCVEKYGANNVHALSYYYQQKQFIELDRAKEISSFLGLSSHMILDISFLGEIAREVSANVRGGKSMPTIKDILGDPSPPTEVPNRNAILLMIAVAYAQSHNLSAVVTGLQAQDQYSYWDTTSSFIHAMNGVISQNRIHKIEISSPFQGLNKTEEIKLLLEMDGNVDLLSHTLTCYNPTETGESCGVCPSCSERIHAFAKAGLTDPVKYSIIVPWETIL
jgi:7-cyano-7-deazaguanine synthase